MVAELDQAQGELKARVFISYSRKDMAFADRLEAALKARGFEPLIDRAEIYAFEDWWKRIQALIGRADTIVFVLSPDAVASDVALKEVAHGATLNKRFAPIVCRRVEIGAVPEEVRRLNFIFFDDPAHFEASADQLAEALGTDIGWVRQHTEYGEAARRWSALGRPGGLLLRPPVLEEAEHWINSRPLGAPAPTDETRAFITASRGDAIRRRLRARAAIAGLIAAAVAGFFAWQYQQATNEEIYWFAHVRGHVLSAAQASTLQPKDAFQECTGCPTMVIVPAGSFMMGSPDGQGQSPEHPEHRVTIARPFAVARFETTFEEWDACASHGNCDPNIDDSGWGRSRQPVINVSWNDAQRYVEWLFKMTGQPYRLLTEAEWEYAARAGTQTAYPWGDDIGKGNANCDGCGSQWDAKQTAPVGSFAANAFGLYDMSGNVQQWVQDCVHVDYNGVPKDGSAWTSGVCGGRVARGGSWINHPQDLRTASRNGVTTGNRNYFLGFRVGRTLVTP